MTAMQSHLPPAARHRLQHRYRASSEPITPGGITVLDPDTDEDTSTEDGPVAHIVRTKPGEDATAKVLEARVNGTPLEALCGHVWVPSRDPKQLPVCERCVRIYRMYREFNDGLDETPRM
jgi:hypothetical protein